jgi:hypothetical protein
MSIKKCHCNGSRGTDCDWCQGTGLVTDTIKSNDYPKTIINESINQKNIERKVFKVINNVVVEERGTPNNLAPQKSFLVRIKELRIEVNQSEKKLLEESIKYLKRKVYKLKADLDEIENRVHKKKKNKFNEIKAQAEAIIKQFEQKYNSKNLGKPHINNSINKQAHTTEKSKGTKIENKKMKSNSSSLASKFSEVFENLKKKLK